MIFCTFWRQKCTKSARFRALKMAKMLILDALHSPKLISRKIWMTSHEIFTLCFLHLRFYVKTFFRSHNHGFPTGDQDQSSIMERASTSMPNIKNEPIEEDNVDRTGSEEQIESFDASQHHITIGSYSNTGSYTVN